MGNNRPRKRTSSFSPVGGSPSRRVKNQAYVVWVGRTLGLFEKWVDVLDSTREHRGAVYAGFREYDQAVLAWEEYEATGVIPSWEEIKAMKTHEPKPTPRQLNATLTERARRNVRDHKGSKTTTCTTLDCRFPYCMC
jgi:viroplasmin and RNaseH domain-containing protein